MSGKQLFRWAPGSTRLIAGAVTSAVAIAAVLGGVALTWPTLTRTPSQVLAIPGAAATTVVCAGDILVLGQDADRPIDPGAVRPQAVTAGVALGDPTPEERRLSLPDADVPGPLAFVAPPADGERTDVAASGSGAIFTPEIAGYAASACRPALTESWLVAGSATTGASDLVLLSNPGTVPATVELTVYGAEGPQVPTGGAGLVVPPGTQRAIALAGLALGAESPVVRVTSSGAPVQATLQASITRVLTPGGVDQVGALVAPERAQTISGVAVTAPPGAAGASDSPTVLRLLAPGADATAQVSVSVVGAVPAAEPAFTIELTAGIPAEVDLGGLGIGRYVVDVVADEPVVSAVWQTTGFGEGADFAWYTPASPIDEPTLFAVPSGAPARVTVANRGTATAEVTLATPTGQVVTTLTVPAGASADAAVPNAELFTIDPAGTPVHAAVSQTGDSALAGFPVWSASVGAPAVLIYP